MRRREFITLVGGMAAWPLTARAQMPMPVIGFLSSRSPEEAAGVAAAFRQGLGDTGFVEGQNLAIVYRWAEGRYDRLPELAADRVSRRVDLIIATGGPTPTRAAMAATATIPIVFVTGDPVKEGLAASLARPDGNATGFSLIGAELTSKRLELLTELVPKARAIGVLVNPNLHPQAEDIVMNAQQVAQAKGLHLRVLKASNPEEIEAAFSAVTELQAEALLVGIDPFFDSQREKLVALAAREAIPTIYWLRDTAVVGGLISYGPNLTAIYREAGTYAGRILKGAKPADLPVQRPTRFDLVINLKTANALGLAIPPALLFRADEVIE